MANRRRRMIADPRANQAVAFSAAVAGNTAIDAAAIVSGSVAAAAVLAHEGASDPHPTYLTAADGDAAYAPISKGVTNGDSHDHSGGDGGTIAYSTLSGLPPITMCLPFHAIASTNITLTSQASGHDWLGSSRTQLQVDLTGYSQIRFVVRVMTGSASANTPIVYLRYRTTFSATAGDFTDSPGTSAVQCSMTSTGAIDTGWIDLASGAKADIHLGCFVSGGDGSASPALGKVTAFVKA